MPDAPQMEQSETLESLTEKLDFDRLPAHVAIIMDGNRRWAKERNLPSFLGHRQGTEAVRHVTTGAVEIGIKVLSLYAFSRENWKRSKEEVQFLMGLFREYCINEKQLMKDKGVRFRVTGETAEMDPKVVEIFQEVAEFTKGGDRTILNVCVNYGARYEILRAAKLMAKDILAGKIEPEKIEEDDFANYLYTSDLPDPDLLIRTSGEVRLSNFLLWQTAYSELYFTPLYWPDFGKKELVLAILDYQARQRRFGK